MNRVTVVSLCCLRYLLFKLSCVPRMCIDARASFCDRRTPAFAVTGARDVLECKLSKNELSSWSVIDRATCPFVG